MHFAYLLSYSQALFLSMSVFCDLQTGFCVVRRQPANFEMYPWSLQSRSFSYAAPLCFCKCVLIKLLIEQIGHFREYRIVQQTSPAKYTQSHFVD